MDEETLRQGRASGLLRRGDFYWATARRKSCGGLVVPLVKGMLNAPLVKTFVLMATQLVLLERFVDAWIT